MICSINEIIENIDNLEPTKLFYYSSCYGYLEGIELSIESVEDDFYALESMLIYAVDNNYINIIKYVIANKYLVDDQYILEISSKLNRTEIIKMLIDNGADVNFNGDCVLRNAILHNNVDLINYLIEHNADINKLNELHKRKLNILLRKNKLNNIYE